MIRESLRAGFLVVMAFLTAQCAAPPVDTLTYEMVRIRFVDSQGMPISYFARDTVFLRAEDVTSYKAYLAGGGFWDELISYEGFCTQRSQEPPCFVDLINMTLERDIEVCAQKRFQDKGFPPGAKMFLVYEFLDGTTFMLPISNVAKMDADNVNVLTIPGALGSGDWKELGDFLFKADAQWCKGRDFDNALIRQCDSLIEKKEKASDLQWAGSLVFVRERWLQPNPRIICLDRKPMEGTPEEFSDLPWSNNTRRTFGSFMAPYSIASYSACVKVLQVNPEDKRAIFWTKVLPWVNGFAPEGKQGEPTSADLVRECKRAYMAERGRLDDYHRFWALKEFMDATDGATFVERYHLHLKGIHHDADLQWALDELNALFKKWPFLRYQVDSLEEWLAYMRQPEWIDPLKKE